MTLYHFGNCVAITYLPYHFLYKYSSLSEYGAFWKCITVGFFYVITQLCKMIMMATFFPDTKIADQHGYDVFGEFLKYTSDLMDFIGIYFSMTMLPGRGHIKVLTVGMGWSGAEIVLTRIVLLWVNAKAVAFDWNNLISSFECNINLMGHFTVAALMYIISRNEFKMNFSWLPPALLLLCGYKYYTIHLLVHHLLLNEFVCILMKALVTVTLGLITLNLYAQVQTSEME